MREYNNQDIKSNEAELDPCIAAEIRMKKALFSQRYATFLFLPTSPIKSPHSGLVLDKKPSTSQGGGRFTKICKLIKTLLEDQNGAVISDLACLSLVKTKYFQPENQKSNCFKRDR